MAAAKIAKPVATAVKTVTTKSGGGAAAPAARSAPPLNGYSPSASPGTYQFQQPSSQLYSGMSIRSIGRRISVHSSANRVDYTKPINTVSMPGATRTQIRIQEQILINKSGGIGHPDVANKINSIAPKYWDELNIDPPL